MRRCPKVTARSPPQCAAAPPRFSAPQRPPPISGINIKSATPTGSTALPPLSNSPRASANSKKGSTPILAPGGQAAISLIDLALLHAGDHILVPASVYHPNRKFTTTVLARFGVTATFYKPGIGAGISDLIQRKHASRLDRKPAIHHDGSARRPRDRQPRLTQKV